MLSENASQLGADFKLPKGCPPTLTVRRIITDLLSHMHNHLKTFVTESHALELDAVGTEYCLSVPAGWTEDVKQLMKDAASDAGLACGPAGAKTREVDVVMEPECAALCALLSGKSKVQLSAGQVLMVIDAGGGTVDMSIHEIERGGEGLVLSERVRSQCILWGATRLDEKVEQWLARLVGGVSGYKVWKMENFQEYQTIMSAWEIYKQEFKGDTDDDRKQEFGGDRDFDVMLPESFRKVSEGQ